VFCYFDGFTDDGMVGPDIDSDFCSFEISVLFCLQNVQLMLILHFNDFGVFQNSNGYVATHLASAA
jgi:hypothetical protein